MDGLRLALILVGIALVALVYFWSARRRRLDREAGDFDRFDAWTDDRLDPLAEGPMDRTAGDGKDGSGGDELRKAELDADPGAASAIAADESDEGIRGPVRSRRSPGRDDPNVMEGLEAIAASLDSRVEPAIGAVDSIGADPPSSADDRPGRKPPVGGGVQQTRTPRSSSEQRSPAAGKGGGKGAPARPAASAASGAGARQSERSAPGRSKVPSSAPAQPDLVVVLNVMAPIGLTFDGPPLRDALENAGLRAGDMQLYHYRAEGQPPESQPIFSALNVIKPGTLPPQAFEGMRTPGVALVLRLPGPERPREAFELMYGTATGIAQELGGRLCDDTRSSLTGQALNHLRERIAELARRQRAGG